MNNQVIKELAKEAGLIATYGSDHEGLRDFDYRKFAQLIVENCQQTLLSNGYDDAAKCLQNT